jgi:predicted ATPase
MAKSFPDGVYLIQLIKPDNAIDSPESYLPQTISQSLQLRMKGHDSSFKQLINQISEKRMLLILDGFEAFQDNIEVLGKLIEKTKTPRFLITSREPLNLPDELTYEIAGFACPSNYQPGDSFAHYESLQLFLHVARQIDPAFTVDEQNAGAVAKICQLVGGIPLGIELAASWVEMFAPHKIAEQIEGNLDFLSSRKLENTPSRPRSLRAVFDYFWNMLSEGEQQTLEFLSTFIDHFDAQAAREIAGASPFFLGALTSRVFLTKSPSGKYRIHETLRRYAAEKLRRKEGIKEQAHLRHCQYYVNFLTERVLQMRTNRQQEAIAEISDTFGNIQNSWLLIIQLLDYDALDASMDGLYLYFSLSSNYRVGQNLYRYCVDHLAEHGERGNPLFERVLNRARARLAVFLDFLGKYNESLTLLENCLAAARATGDQSEIAFCLTRLGWVNMLLGKNQENSQSLWQEARQIYYQTEDKPGIITVLSALASLLPPEESLPLLKEKMRLAEEVGDTYGTAEWPAAISIRRSRSTSSSIVVMALQELISA